MAKATSGLLADLLARIVGGIQGLMIAPLLALGCQSTDASDKPAPPEVAVVQPSRPTVDEGPKKLGLFNITFYYVTNEEEVVASAKRKAAKAAAANDNVGEGGEAELASITPPEM